MRRCLLVLLLAACGRSGPLQVTDGGADAGSDGGCRPTSYADACAAVKGSVFASLSKGECGRCPDGQDCSCTWHVTFSEPNHFAWQHSDYGESGDYGCDGFNLTGTGTLGPWTAPYDPKCDLLTWDGRLYAREK